MKRLRLPAVAVWTASGTEAEAVATDARPRAVARGVRLVRFAPGPSNRCQALDRAAAIVFRVPTDRRISFREFAGPSSDRLVGSSLRAEDCRLGCRKSARLQSTVCCTRGST